MNRTGKILTVLLAAAFLYTMPTHACWWNYIDDMYSFDEDCGCDDGGYDYGGYDYYDDSGCDDYSYDLGGYDYYYGYDDWYDDNSGYNDYAWDITLDEVEVTGGSSNDSFWDNSYFFEQDCGMDDSGSYFDSGNSQQPSDSQSDAVQNEYPGEFGNANVGQTGNVRASENLRSGEPMGKYWLDPSRRCSVSDLRLQIKYYNNSNVIPNLPDKFIKQGQNADCTARAIATAVWLASGERTDYDYVMQMAYIVAREHEISISSEGVLSTNYMQIYCEYFDITEIKPGGITSSEIKSYIDSGQTLTGSFCTGDIEYVWDPPIKGAHDVTIIGYSDDSYFCAYGEEDVLKVPKDAIESHAIHVVNGIKDSFVITNK